MYPKRNLLPAGNLAMTRVETHNFNARQYLPSVGVKA